MRPGDTGPGAAGVELQVPLPVLHRILAINAEVLKVKGVNFADMRNAADVREALEGVRLRLPAIADTTADADADAGEPAPPPPA